VHFAVGGVHVCDVFVANAVHHDKVMQHPFHDNMGDGGQRYRLQRLWFGTNSFGLEPQFARRLNHTQHVSAPQLLILAVVSLYAFRAVAHSRVFTAYWLCLVFSKDFNTMAAILSTNRKVGRK
jgi:hypothetical protein